MAQNQQVGKFWSLIGKGLKKLPGAAKKGYEGLKKRVAKYIYLLRKAKDPLYGVSIQDLLNKSQLTVEDLINLKALYARQLSAAAQQYQTMQAYAKQYKKVLQEAAKPFGVRPIWEHPGVAAGIGAAGALGIAGLAGAFKRKKEKEFSDILDYY